MAATQTKTPAQREIRQAEIISLQREGLTNYDIAERLGTTESTVRHHQRAWVAAKEPPAEIANELRERWGDRLEFAHRANWPQVEAGDAKAIEVMLRIQAQFAKLFGLELQPGMQVNLFTAEAFAAWAEWDPPVVEGSAVELGPGDSA